jgi:Translation initiation factor 2B subunit, eIF-2B alpha/beta/delta family
MKAINAAVNDIKNDKVHGASYLTDKALEAIKNAAESSQADSNEYLWQELSDLASGLMACRPTMVSICNCIHRCISELQKYYANNPDLDSLRTFTIKTVQNIRNEFLLARSLAIQAGAGLIADREQIMTCSYSSTMIQTMVYAHEQGKSFYVLVARSQEGPDEIAYGDKMAFELSRYGIECEVFPDTDILEKAKQADKLMVGADAILPDSSLLNGYPTAELAQAAEQANIPFYTVCESNKFLHRDMPDTIEKGFNLVPACLVCGIVSEMGTMTPSQVCRLLKQEQIKKEHINQEIIADQL